MEKKFRILVSNDDGIYSEGIIALREAMLELGEVFVYAPHKQQSAVGHAITTHLPLRVNPYYMNGEFFGYAVTGTPADCVKLAVTTHMKVKPDLIVSGINHGSNAAINVIYSGTVSAATEGTILGIPSIAFSLTTYVDFDFTYSKKVAKIIAQAVLKYGLPPGVLLNVNIPPVPEDKIKGIKITKQGKSRWNDYFEKRVDPQQREYYWLTGTMDNIEDDEESDIRAIQENYVSVTPIQFDLTDYDFLEKLKQWEFK
ncbi:MAG: 5'/3'-nucleotidase SurE [Ignavibacteria bacterium]|jgi:5'-nucleotidase|nr:5'/3'-nucleotidase SurE [Ignavibacteria bacterium]MDH7526639.1 5'/3'-nucleotidase SurE [Ignavibacteria bacterium]